MLFNSSVGIEISDYEINIVYLKGSFKGMHLAAESGCQIDRGKSRHDRQSDTVNFINGFFREEKISAADIFIGIPGDYSMMREIEFPVAVKENLRTTLAYEIEKYIPVSADDLYFDYQIISENKAEEKLKLLLVAVKKKIFERYLKVAELIDNGVSGIEIVPAAKVNYFLYHHGSFQEPAMLVYSRNHGYDVMIIKNCSMVYSKSFTVSGVSADNLAFESEQLLRLRDIFFPDDEAVALVLYGISDSDDRVQPLTKEFQQVIRGSAHAAPRSVKNIPAFGLALKGMQNIPVQMNLMPVHLRKKPNKAGIYLMFVLAGLLVLAGAAWAGSHLMIQRQILKNLDTELARLRTKASAVEAIQVETEQAKRDIAYFRSLRPGNTYVIQVAEELSNIIPADAWLTELKLVENKMSLYGTAESASGLISLLEESSLFEDVEFISAIRKSRDGKEVFRIGCRVHSRK